jgi:hypothetical protein
MIPCGKNGRSILLALACSATLATAACAPPVSLVEVTATPSPTATVTPTPIFTPTPTATPTPTPAPPSVLLEPMNHQQQTLNNCGPASTAIVLGYFDACVTQHDVNRLAPTGNVGHDNPLLAGYGLSSRMYWLPATRAPLQYILANGIPMIMHSELYVDSEIHHFRVLHGYDDAAGEFIMDDPLLGADYRLSYTTFFSLTHPHGYIYPVYPAEGAALVDELAEYHGLSESGGCFDSCHTVEDMLEYSETE